MIYSSRQRIPAALYKAYHSLLVSPTSAAFATLFTLAGFVVPSTTCIRAGYRSSHAIRMQPMPIQDTLSFVPNSKYYIGIPLTTIE